MRQGKVFYKDYFAGVIKETDEGEYIFQYDSNYVMDHSDHFITLLCLFLKGLTQTTDCFPFLKA